MSLSALPTFLLLPPANLLLPACAGAVLHRRRAGRLLLALSLTGLVVFALPAVSMTLLQSLESGLPLTPPANDPPAAIVVLSADEEGRLIDGQPHYDIGTLTLERERAAAALARASGLPVLLSGGRGKPDSPPLAELMARSMREDFGITAKWLETASKNTWQNAAFSAAILSANHVDSVYVVTNAWHMRRALIAFRHAGLHATAAPVQIDAPLRWEGDDFIPGSKPWEFSYLALHEWVGCLWYAWLAR